MFDDFFFQFYCSCRDATAPHKHTHYTYRKMIRSHNYPGAAERMCIFANLHKKIPTVDKINRTARRSPHQLHIAVVYVESKNELYGNNVVKTFFLFY